MIQKQAESAAPRANPFEGHPAKQIREIKLPTATLGIDLDASGTHLDAACLDGGIYRVNPADGAFERYGSHTSYASGVAVIGDGARTVSAGYDGTVRWHDPAKREPLRQEKAHRSWSWQLAAHEGTGRVASAGGQYLCGGYRYEPRAADEPPVKVYDLESGDLVHALDHVPPVQSIAFSPDGRHLAAGNLMGEVRVWEAASGKQVAGWTTPSFTGWGIIKGHYYTGGIFSMFFTPDGDELICAGMGSTRDPAAGNGRQLWQRFAWREDPVRKVDETHSGESGAGLMETVRLHPSGRYFVMAGRNFKGKWNVAFFDTTTGSILHHFSCGMRVTASAFSPDGRHLYLSGAVKQQRKDGEYPPWGRVKIYDVPRGFRSF